MDIRPSTASYRLVTQKKSLIASERDPWQRAVFALEQAELDASQIVVIDEVGSNLDLTPTHAWAPVGQRASATAPRNTPLNTTTIASLSHQGMGPALLVKGGVDRLTFESYLEQVLAPTLQEGQVVLVDNLSAHRSTRAQAIVAACGCRLRYLPPYSPDYSPIELAFAQIKADLRRAAVFESPRYVHRCRNLSNATPALTLHVYGGELERYVAFDESAGALRAEPRIAISDPPLE